MSHFLIHLIYSTLSVLKSKRRTGKRDLYHLPTQFVLIIFFFFLLHFFLKLLLDSIMVRMVRGWTLHGHDWLWLNRKFRCPMSKKKLWHPSGVHVASMWRPCVVQVAKMKNSSPFVRHAAPWKLCAHQEVNFMRLKQWFPKTDPDSTEKSHQNFLRDFVKIFRPAKVSQD